MDNLPANPEPEWTPSLREQQERDEHRVWIAGRALTLLSHFWRDDDPIELTAALGADWADVLEGTPQEYIQRACIQYQRDEPRRKPTPGAIYQLARELMPRPQAVPVAQPEPEREPPCSREAAAEIMAQAGFRPRKMETRE